MTVATRLIVRGGCVLSMDSAIGNRRDTDVLIDNGIVSEVGSNLRARGAQEIDARNAVVMPGFVDAHRHAGEALARHARAGESMTANDVYAATLVGLLSALESGVTTVADWSAFTGDGHIAAAVEAHADAGVRSVFVIAGADPTEWAHHVRSVRTPSPLTSVAAGPPTPEDWTLAREAGMRVHVHAGVDGISPADAAQLLGPDVTLSHCTNLSSADLDAIAASGTGVVLTPASDMAGGAPPIPVQDLIDRGIRPGLGVGSLAMASGDMFAQLRIVVSLQHAMYFDAKLAGKAGLPRLMTTRDVIRSGTVDGANAIGLGSVAGSIALGRPADLVVLRTDRPNVMPVNDPIGAVVWGMDTSNVDTILVAGRPLVREGTLTGDLTRVRALTTTSPPSSGSNREAHERRRAAEPAEDVA